jgi:hypothetical protein
MYIAEATASQGHITAVRGSVVEAIFDREFPAINEGIWSKIEGWRFY